MLPEDPYTQGCLNPLPPGSPLDTSPWATHPLPRTPPITPRGLLCTSRGATRWTKDSTAKDGTRLTDSPEKALEDCGPGDMNRRLAPLLGSWALSHIPWIQAPAPTLRNLCLQDLPLEASFPHLQSGENFSLQDCHADERQCPNTQ